MRYLLLLMVCLAGAARAQDHADPDWPCVQRKQPHLSLGQMWTGPAPDDATRALARSPEIAALADRLEQRRLPLEEGKRLPLLDVGSGGGLPGVVFAICCPQIDVNCVDTVGKKAAFIQQVAAALRLPNLRGIHDRVENLKTRYPVISCRAFASLVDFTTWSRKALAEDGIWFAMKGKHPDEEIAALPADVKVFHVEPLQVPGLDAERCVIWLKLAS